MKPIFPLLILLLQPAFAYTQTKVLQVLDSLSLQPIEGVMFVTKKKQPIAANKSGCAKITITNPTTITTIHAAYAEQVKTVTANSPDTITFFLKPNVEQLEAASVSALRKQVKMDAKSATLDLSLAKNAPFWRLKDALEQIPGVKVDETEGVVTYMGNPVSFKENGFSSPNLTLNLKSILQMPAAEYKQVELIFFDPKNYSSGMGGSNPIIDLSKPKEDSFWGRVSPNFSLSSAFLSGMIGWQRKIQLLEFTALYSHGIAPESTGSGYMVIPAAQRKQESSSSMDTWSSRPSFSARYNLDFTKHVFDLSISCAPLTSSNMTSNSTVTEYDSDILYRHYTSSNGYDMQNNTLNAVFGYIYRMSNQSKLNFTIQADGNKNENDTYLHSTVEGAPLKLSSYEKNKITKNANFFTSLSYETKHPKAGAFEVGGSYFSRNTWDDLNFRPLDANGSVLSEELMNYNSFYDYGSLFASWMRMFGKTSFRLVMKGDYSSNRLTSTGYSDEKFVFYSLAPYLSLSRNFGSHSLFLSGEYSEKRPSLYSLNPIVEPGQAGASRIVTRGNPSLQPAKNIRATVSYSFPLFKKIETSINTAYTHTYDNIQTYQTIEQDTIILRTYANLASSDIVGGILSFRWPITTKLTLNANANGDLQLYQYNNKDAEASKAISWYTNINLQYRIGERWSTSLGGGYNLWEYYQIKADGIWTTSASISYRHKSLMIYLALGNFHKPKDKRKNTLEANGYSSVSYSESWQSSLINFSLSYRFGSQKNVKQSAKAIKVDDM